MLNHTKRPWFTNEEIIHYPHSQYVIKNFNAKEDLEYNDDHGTVTIHMTELRWEDKNDKRPSQLHARVEILKEDILKIAADINHLKPQSS